MTTNRSYRIICHACLGQWSDRNRNWMLTLPKKSQEITNIVVNAWFPLPSRAAAAQYSMSLYNRIIRKKVKRLTFTLRKFVACTWYLPPGISRKYLERGHHGSEKRSKVWTSARIHAVAKNISPEHRRRNTKLAQIRVRRWETNSTQEKVMCSLSKK